MQDLSLFYNLTLNFSGNNKLYFNVKKSLKYSQQFLDSLAQKASATNMIHIADRDPEYYSVFLDENGGVWQLDIQKFTYYGKPLTEGLLNIINKKPFKTIQYYE